MKGTKRNYKLLFDDEGGVLAVRKGDGIRDCILMQMRMQGFTTFREWHAWQKELLATFNAEVRQATAEGCPIPIAARRAFENYCLGRDIYVMQSLQ